MKKITKKEYLFNHNKSNIKVGDKVKVLKKAKYLKGWNNSWEDEMDGAINHIYEVIKDNGDMGFELDCLYYCDDSNYNFPYFVLEKVEEKKDV